MEDYFILPVKYNGEILEFEGRLLPQGYVHKIEIIINKIPVLFEPDEERSYRALVSTEHLEGKAAKLSYGLLKAIAEKLESLPG
ncbi:hypothetical protein [Hufsiella ginkgonis]|uniref:Uncharacterized protein n=1 Tax=Hufsiella ginkgonis TaxID=2695274 RepID=A0A7K1XUT1_9SPHI|nr:hypothetical protein [Hufsiella ginkgonis]MXV14529.1 hypothetical protein [Hufsiella ginkgonis]